MNAIFWYWIPYYCILTNKAKERLKRLIYRNIENKVKIIMKPLQVNHILGSK